MSVLKKYKTPILLFLLMLVGFWLRFHLVSTQNMATDEIATLVTASQPFPKGILHALATKNFHAPLYYFLLHFWLILFGDSTLSLRTMPVLFGTLCIPVAYACGKELFSKFAGWSTAVLVTFNVFLINYSYFGKFYSLLALLGFVSVYFILQISKNPQKKYFAGLACINACIIYTYVIGFVFVALQFLLFAGYDFFIAQKKQNFKRWLLYALGVFLLTAPILPMMWVTIKNTQSAVAPGFWWYEYDIGHIIAVIMAWFSPALSIYFTGINTEIIQRFEGELWWSLLWNIVPTLLAGAVLGITVGKKRILDLLLLTAGGFLLCELLATLVGRFAFVPRYTLLVFPALILGIGVGVALLKKRVFAYAVLGVLLVVNIGYLYAFADKGILVSNKIFTLAEQLENLKLGKGDKVILPMRGYLLTYFYHPQEVAIISFDLNYTLKTGDPQILSKLYSAQDIDEAQPKAWRKFERYINSRQPTAAISNYFRQDILADFQKNNRMILVDNCENKTWLVLDTNQADDKTREGMLFNALCEKVASDVKAVLQQNNFQETEYIPEGNIFVYRPLSEDLPK